MKCLIPTLLDFLDLDEKMLFYATVCFEEYGDTRKLHWMTESQ
jgi:hypothetical protein